MNQTKSNLNKWRETGLSIVAYGGGELTHMGSDFMAKVSKFTEENKIPLHIYASSGSAFSAWVVTKLGIRDHKLLQEIACDFDLSGGVSVKNIIKYHTLLEPNSLFKKFIKVKEKYGVQKSYGDLSIITTYNKSNSNIPIISNVTGDGLDKDTLLKIESSCSFPLLISGNKHFIPYLRRQVKLTDGDLSEPAELISLIRDHSKNSPLLSLSVELTHPLTRALFRQTNKRLLNPDINIVYPTPLFQLGLVKRKNRKKFLKNMFTQAETQHEQIIRTLFSTDPTKPDKKSYSITTDHRTKQKPT